MEWDANLANRLGLIIGFISFWLAAPEILGEDRLVEAERWLEKAISLLLPIAAVAYFLYFIYILIFWGFGVPPNYTPDYEQSYEYIGKAAACVILMLGVQISFNRVFKSRRYLLSVSSGRFITVGLTFVVIVVLGVLSTGEPNSVEISQIWNIIKIPIVVTILTTSFFLLGPRILQRLADDSAARQRFLAIGAVLFIISFILQFVATY